MQTPFILLLLLWQAVASYAEVELAVIVHPSVTVDSLDKARLLDYYTGDIQRWPDGEVVVVKDLREKGEVRDGFYRFLGKRPSRMKSIWLRRMLSGEGKPPEGLATEADVLAGVAQTPGAMGFIRHSQVSDAVRVVLLIIGDEGVSPGR
jgi:ABC-type phosphate transport system substrate-binding protein